MSAIEVVQKKIVNGKKDRVTGWNRRVVYRSLIIKTFPIDLLSFDSEYDKHKFRGAYSNNQPEHHPTAAAMTQV